MVTLGMKPRDDAEYYQPSNDKQIKIKIVFRCGREVNLLGSLGRIH